MSSFGQEIKRERELRQISLREIAETTKVSLRYLEALENNDFEQLPGGVFNRGFVRAYAEHIGVDAEAMVNAYLLEERGQDSPGDQPSEADAVFRAKNGAVLAGSTAQPGTPIFKWGLIALVAAGVVVAVILVYLKLSAPTVGDLDPIVTEPKPPLEQTVLPVERPREAPGVKPSRLEPTDEATSRAAREALDRPDEPEPQPAAQPVVRAAIDAVIHVDRPTSGRLNCDNRRIEMLDGVRAGTVLELSCTSFLIVDAADAGALRLALAGQAADRLGANGQRLSAYRIEATHGGSTGAGERP